MNGYIINPMWFYWIGVCEGAKIVCYIIGCLCAAGVIISTITYFVDKGFNDDAAELGKRWTVRLGVVVIVAVLIGTLIPSKETLVQMKLAELGTYDNANKVIEIIQDATDYILDRIGEE